MSKTNQQCVNELIRKAENTEKADEALKFSQAACNAANAMCALNVVRPVNQEMIDRFLMWRLPESFSPDGGITFQKPTPTSWPVGTNLFTATEARAMLEYVLG